MVKLFGGGGAAAIFFFFFFFFFSLKILMVSNVGAIFFFSQNTDGFTQNNSQDFSKS